MDLPKYNISVLTAAVLFPAPPPNSCFPHLLVVCYL